MNKEQQLLQEFAEKYVGVNNGEKHCSAPEDCYWHISDTNICSCPEVCTWNSDKADKFNSDLTALIDKVIEARMPTELEFIDRYEEIILGKIGCSEFIEWFRSRMRGESE